MFWECSECGGLTEAAPKGSVCPTCGTASSQIVPVSSTSWDLSELRDHWVYAGMEQEAPILDFPRA